MSLWEDASSAGVGDIHDSSASPAPCDHPNAYCGSTRVWGERLWWGDANSVQNLRHWQTERQKAGLPAITHVCNVASQPGAVPINIDQRLSEVSYLELQMLDAPHMASGTGLWAETQRHLRQATIWVDEAVAGGGVVLVNCYAGLNRSAAVLLVWLQLPRCEAEPGSEAEAARTEAANRAGLSSEAALKKLRALQPAALQSNRALLQAAQDVAADQDALIRSKTRTSVGSAGSGWALDIPTLGQAKDKRKKNEEIVEEEQEEAVGSVGGLFDDLDLDP